MTTVVEPEHAPRRLKGVRLLAVAAAVTAAAALIVAGAIALARDEPPPSTMSMPDISHGPYVAEASFVLQNYGTLSTEAHQFWRELTLDHVVSLGLPFSRYNRYYTRFFLREGETAEILIESNVPLGANLGDRLEGIAVMLMPAGAPYEQSQAYAYLPPTENAGNGGYFTRLTRTGGNWTVGWAMTALSSDYYWLVLANTARQDAWCHFTVNVPA